MDNWEEMKDFSYVGIKLTKAHSLSQGINRCKIQRLTRKNPVYEHLSLHKKMKKNSVCSLCSKESDPKDK